MNTAEFNDRTDKAPATATSRLAIASLVLGVLSFALSILAGLPALATGLAALQRIREANGTLTGRGLAIAGCLAGLVGSVAGWMFLATRLPSRPGVPGAADLVRRRHPFA